MTRASLAGALGAAGGFLGVAGILAQTGTEWGGWVGSVGFPIAVAGFLLLRMEERLARLARAFDRLARALEKAHGIKAPASEEAEAG